ncbi:nuclear transport factor 2 family protein [Kribbella sp. NPDC006257]|uniref:nuclear transport factor 2 family protein n=1 Tax=Kribbella sp. NPDC006257 TaxID=3156738 RepID=UPI0033B08E6B
MQKKKIGVVVALATAGVGMIPLTSSAVEVADHQRPDAAKIVAGLDTQYQAAVKRNDARTMSRILADDFVLVTGRGSTYSKADLVGDARAGSCTYEQQDEVAGTQTVRLYGPATAIVTALLWEKGTCTDGSTFDSHLWFSDTYVKISGRWSYVFGQASRAL